MSTAAATHAPADQHGWSRLHSNALLVLLTAIVAVGVLVPRQIGPIHGEDQARLYAWLAISILLGAFAVVVGHGITGLRHGVLVDERNRISLARLQMLLWTVLVLSAYLAAALANVGAGDLNPLGVSVPEELWLAMGISTTSLVASPLLLSGKKLARGEKPHDARWTDLFVGEETGTEHHADLGKIQLFFFTVVLVLGYAVAVGQSFGSHAASVHALPRIDAAVVILLTISHAGYLTKKAIPQKLS